MMPTEYGKDSNVDNLGLGLVGAGAFGEFCLDAYNRMEEIDVVAVADINLERAEAIAPPMTHCYRRYEELLADPNVNIVAINTPPNLHARIAIEAANLGKHIFIEKPLAISLDEAVEVAKCAHNAGVKISINNVLRYHPLHKLVFQLTHNRVLGAFQHWSLNNYATDDNLNPGHWFWDQSISGGIFIEHGVHFFDLCNQIVKKPPTQVSGFSQKRVDGRIDRVCASVLYGNEVLATFYHSFNQIERIEQTTIRLKCTHGQMEIIGWIPTKLRLHGLVDEGGLTELQGCFGDKLTIVDRFEDTAIPYHHGSISERLIASVSAVVKVPDRQAEYQRAIQAGMRDLFFAIHQDRSPEVTIEDGIASLTIAIAAVDSARTGKIVRPTFEEKYTK